MLHLSLSFVSSLIQSSVHQSKLTENMCVCIHNQVKFRSVLYTQRVKELESNFVYLGYHQVVLSIHNPVPP